MPGPTQHHRGKSGLDYLRREIRLLRAEIMTGQADKLAQAQQLDLVRWFESRLAAAYLVDKLTR